MDTRWRMFDRAVCWRRLANLCPPLHCKQQRMYIHALRTFVNVPLAVGRLPQSLRHSSY